jgi:hypothetical protein
MIEGNLKLRALLALIAVVAALPAAADFKSVPAQFQGSGNGGVRPDHAVVCETQSGAEGLPRADHEAEPREAVSAEQRAAEEVREVAPAA